MEKIAKHKSELAAISREAQKHAKSYDWKLSTEKIVDLYQTGLNHENKKR